jgi:hypothetical protein
MISRDEIMRAICDRKEMYFQPVDSQTAKTFIDGFSTGCFAFGIHIDWQAAETERGWTANACGPVAEMRQRGLSDQAIVDELLAILKLTVERASNVAH